MVWFRKGHEANTGWAPSVGYVAGIYVISLSHLSLSSDFWGLLVVLPLSLWSRRSSPLVEESLRLHWSNKLLVFSQKFS